MSEFPQILGIYSLEQETDIGDGGTQKKHQNKTFWYARQLSHEQFEVQPLNANHVPSGVCNKLEKIDFLRSYTPEPTYYKLHTVPALQTLARKIEQGEQAFADGQMEEAERQFIKALMIDELSVDANFGLGEVYSETSNFAKLKQVLGTLMGLDAAFTMEHRQKFNSFGISLRKNGHFDESIRYYEKSLEVISDDENVYFNMARVFFDKGERERCLVNLRKALELNPEFVEAQKFVRYCERMAATG